jgi:hypothetical protein
MATNYGIGFCREGIRVLEAEEERMFEELGHGFDKFSQAYLQLQRYKRMLVTFSREKELGLRPSYRPEIHGSLSQ